MILAMIMIGIAKNKKASACKISLSFFNAACSLFCSFQIEGLSASHKGLDLRTGKIPCPQASRSNKNDQYQ